MNATGAKSFCGYVKDILPEKRQQHTVCREELGNEDNQQVCKHMQLAFSATAKEPWQGCGLERKEREHSTPRRDSDCLPGGSFQPASREGGM